MRSMLSSCQHLGQRQQYMCTLKAKLQGEICNVYVHMQSTMGIWDSHMIEEVVAFSSAWRILGELSERVPDCQSWPPGLKALM